MFLRLGDVEIWRILESIDPFLEPHKFFPGMGEDALEFLRREVPRQLCPRTGKVLIPIQGFLLKTGRHNILIDACVGNDKTCRVKLWNKRSDGRFMAGLQAVGVTPEDVDYVMCTHLHLDHVGWNTRLEDGRWVPTFPNAKYIFPKEDHAHYGADPDTFYQESILPVIAAGQAELVSADHCLGDAVSLIPTPGHTPGHMSVRVSSPEGSVIISGDAIHSPVQCLRPDWHFVYDLDGAQAEKSRRALLELVCETPVRLIGSHFPLPSIGYVTGNSAGFGWREA
ncbi:MBL fold metallo-hydrolase [Oceanibium sediminis]|uniref:MBL fold metallo-hydrolase n=1 Tax=Oceanibium sediminis TaxID=2026339 RepID=UPI000DD3A781|nr:MBL fold metallo-hydrolase [Oceanibium sediminis]